VILLPLLLSAALARPDSVGTISGARATPGKPTVLSLGLQGGAGFLAGGTGSAYASALDLGLVVDFHLSPFASVGIEADHVLFRVDNGAGLFDEPAHEAADPSFSGSQRHYAVDAGFRLGLPVIDESRLASVKTWAIPWIRLAGGFAWMDTRLDVPTFDGQYRIRQVQGMGTVTPGLGVAVHFGRSFTVEPSFKAVGLLGLDHDEVDNSDAFRSEWRLVPAVHVLFNL